MAFAFAMALAVYLIWSIYGPMKEQERITNIEAKVINQLEIIRKAEKAYLEINSIYSNDWDELIAFVDTGVIYETQRSEEFFQRPIEKAYLGDSVAITIDTIGSMLVQDKIFPKVEYPNFESKRLPFVPDSEDKFILEVGSIRMGRADVSLIRVVDPKPVNVYRKSDDENRLKWPLQFGSLDEATTDGNWK